MTTYVHSNDIGTIFRLTITDTAGVVIDVSTATVKYIYFQMPDGTKKKKTAAFYTDGSDLHRQFPYWSRARCLFRLVRLIKSQLLTFIHPSASLLDCAKW